MKRSALRKARSALSYGVERNLPSRGADIVLCQPRHLYSGIRRSESCGRNNVRPRQESGSRRETSTRPIKSAAYVTARSRTKIFTPCDKNVGSPIPLELSTLATVYRTPKDSAFTAPARNSGRIPANHRDKNGGCRPCSLAQPKPAPRTLHYPYISASARSITKPWSLYP